MRQIIYVGMDLFPPYNEICSRLVNSLITGLQGKRAFRVLSFPNPRAKDTAPLLWRAVVTRKENHEHDHCSD